MDYVRANICQRYRNTVQAIDNTEQKDGRKYTMEKDFDELTIADDIAKKCTSCTFLSYKFSYRKLATA